jgi:hypothetical protein
MLDNRHSSLLRGVCAGLIAGVAVGCGPSDRQINRVIENAAPLISAIRRYDAANGRAPADLKELMPGYIDHIPHTGLEVGPEYIYGVREGEPWHWALSVHIESLGFRHMSYDSTGKYQLTPSPIRDGWVIINP